jgi:glyceraldehyde 3-phosphate dehydrogenase
MRKAEGDPMVTIVANDPFISTNYMEYMFKYDSTHGNLQGRYMVMNPTSRLDGQNIQVSTETTPPHHRCWCRLR